MPIASSASRELSVTAHQQLHTSPVSPNLTKGEGVGYSLQ